MANSKLLKEAIADAKAVRETAIANAKIALEEAFTPRLQSILSKKLQQEIEDSEAEEEVNEDLNDGSDAPEGDSTEIGKGDNKQPADDANSSSDLAQGNPDTEADSAEVGKEDENSEVISEEDEELPGEDQSRIEEDESEEEISEEEEDEDELDLEAIIRELEGELEEEDGEDEMHEEEGEESSEEEMHEEEGEESHEEEAPVAEEEGEESSEEGEEEIDLDEILREMGYGDDEEEKVEESEEEEANESWKEEKEAELEEAYNVIKSLKKTINEVNLLNAKLLYTNKLFRSYDLTNEQKHKVVETLDRTQNVREVKLVFSTLAESMKIGGTAKKVKPQTKINESFASKPVASTAPKKEIIAESNGLAERFKQLANIK